MDADDFLISSFYRNTHFKSLVISKKFTLKVWELKRAENIPRYIDARYSESSL